jgi:sulfur-oxidizing protein SoxZ
MARSVMIKTKPKTYAIGDIIQVDAILEHPMATGLAKDKDGKVIPAHHITEIKVDFDGKTIMNMDMTGSVSTNPFISFNLKVTKNAPLKITAKDNKGEVQESVKDI